MANTVPSLKLENSALKKEITAFKAEIRKLQTKNGKLEAENYSQKERIKALEKLKVLPESEPLSDFEAARRIAFILNKGGLDIHGNPLPK